MSSSYSDLQTYRSCPRLFGFQKLGYIPPTITEPLATGGLTHIGISAHLKGQSVDLAMDAAIEVNYKAGMSKLSGNNRYQFEATLSEASSRSRKLLSRYTSKWIGDLKLIEVEPCYEIGGVVCHPDLIAYLNYEIVIVDFKTSYNPDERWYDMSGQTDLYALVYKLVSSHEVELIVYDVISDSGIFRHQRPPRWNAARRLFYHIQELNKLITSVKPPYEVLLNDPHPDFTCPSRCDFFIPCWLLETDTWDTCKDYLEENYLK